MRRPIQLVGGLLCAVVLTGALGACGVPTSSSARAIARDQVPTGPSTTTTTVPVGDEVPVTIVLLDSPNATPVAVTRFAPALSAHLSIILGDLLLGPAPGRETSRGLTTAIPTGTRLISVSPNPLTGTSPSSPVTVNLTNDFAQITGTEQVAAVEQVVFTIACNLSPTTKVLFELEGLPIQDVPVATGAAVARAVTAADYAAAAPTCAQ